MHFETYSGSKYDHTLDITYCDLTLTAKYRLTRCIGVKAVERVIDTTPCVLISSCGAYWIIQYGIAGGIMQRVVPAICIGHGLGANTGRQTSVVHRPVKVLHLQHVLTPSSGSILIVQYDIGNSPLVRIFLLNTYHISYCPRCIFKRISRMRLATENCSWGVPPQCNFSL